MSLINIVDKDWSLASVLPMGIQTKETLHPLIMDRSECSEEEEKRMT